MYTTRTNLQARYDLFCVKSVVKPQPTNQPTVYVYDRIRLVHDCLHGPCTRPCSGLADGRVGPCNGRVRAVYTTVYIHDCVHVRVVYTCRRPYTRAVYVHGRVHHRVHGRVHHRVHRPYRAVPPVHGRVPAVYTGRVNGRVRAVYTCTRTVYIHDHLRAVYVHGRYTCTRPVDGRVRTVYTAVFTTHRRPCIGRVHERSFTRVHGP